MYANYEKRTFSGREKVWIGKYESLHNAYHWHEENELIYCKEGSAQVLLDGRTYTLFAGNGIFCRGGSAHRIDEDRNSLIYVCIFSEIITPFIPEMVLEDPVFCGVDGVAEVIEAALRELKEKPVLYEMYAAALIGELVIRIFRQGKVVAATELSASRPRFYALLERIATEFESIDFAEAAHFMNYSEAYFSKNFKKQTGMTFSQYLNVVRIGQAVKMINRHPDMKLQEVALQCGFANSRTFGREFIKVVGCPPREMPKGYQVDVHSMIGTFRTFDPTEAEKTVLVEAN